MKKNASKKKSNKRRRTPIMLDITADTIDELDWAIDNLRAYVASKNPLDFRLEIRMVVP